MVWAVDVIPSAVSVASMRLEHRYDQSGIARAVVPALSPLPTLPPKAALSALLAGAAAVAPAGTPPEAEAPQ